MREMRMCYDGGKQEIEILLTSYGKWCLLSCEREFECS